MDGQGSIPSRGKTFFFLLHNVQAGSGAYIDSYPMGTDGSFPGENATGA
jgi:hypothetical protein